MRRFNDVMFATFNAIWHRSLVQYEFTSSPSSITGWKITIVPAEIWRISLMYQSLKFQHFHTIILSLLVDGKILTRV
jgi:hypothetical protein